MKLHLFEFFKIFFLFPSPAPEGRTDTIQLSYIPQMLADYIQYKYIYSTDTCSPIQRPKGAQTPCNCHIFPKCWQKISNTSICIQLTHVPQSSVSPTQRPKGAQTSSKCHTSPKCWQNIFNKKYMYSTDTCSPIQRPQGAQTPSNCQISPKCWQNISNTNICIFCYVYICIHI